MDKQGNVMKSVTFSWTILFSRILYYIYVYYYIIYYICILYSIDISILNRQLNLKF